MPRKKIERARMIISIDHKTKERVELEAEKLGISMNGFVNVCVVEYLKQRDAMDMLEVVGGIDNLRILIQNENEKAAI